MFNQMNYNYSYVEVITKITILGTISIITAIIGPFSIILRYIFYDNYMLFIITDYIISMETFII